MRYDLEIRASNCYCDLSLFVGCGSCPQQHGVERGALAIDFDLVRATCISIEFSLIKEFALRCRENMLSFLAIVRDLNQCRGMYWSQQKKVPL
jgi:hypothetical protein